MARRSFVRLPVTTLVILRICVCILAIYFLGDSSPMQFSVAGDFWQLAAATSVSDPANDDRLDDSFVLPGLEMMGDPGVLTAPSSHNLHWLSRPISPLLPPPQILELA